MSVKIATNPHQIHHFNGSAPKILIAFEDMAIMKASFLRGGTYGSEETVSLIVSRDGTTKRTVTWILEADARLLEAGPIGRFPLYLLEGDSLSISTTDGFGIGTVLEYEYV